MAATMRAAQYDKKTQRVIVNNIAIPKAKQDQLQVKITAASLCHSDLMMSLRPDNLGPLTIGHEAVGIVSQIHPSAVGKGFQVDDRVGIFGVIDSCYACEGCLVHTTFCINSSKGGAKIQGLQTHGFFAEYAVADWRSVIVLPESLPMERMSPLFCAGITAFHGVDKCNLEPGQWLAIVGCGGLGQFAVRYAKAKSLNVIALDIDDHMLDTAKQNGADATINPSTDPKFHRSLRKLTKSRGCHAAVVFSDANAAYATAQRTLTFNGLLMIVGLPEKPLQFPAGAISTNMFRVRGASNGTPIEMKKAVDFTAKHQIIPHVEFRALEEMPQMWDELAQGKARRKLAVRFQGGESKL